MVQMRTIYCWTSKNLLKHRGTYVLLNAEFQTSILDHVDAIVIVSWPEQTFTLLQLYEHHVATKLQEEGLLKMTQNPET